MITRMSRAAMGRGLSRCQPSNSKRRVCSPVASETRAARSTMLAQAGQTPLLRLGLEGDFESVIGAKHLERVAIAAQLFIANAVFVHPLNLLIVMERIMME